MPSTNERILVTGGAGFIGTAVARRLLATGADVRVVDRVPDDRQRVSRASLVDGGAEFVTADLADVDLPALLRDVSSVIHLAGRPGVQTSWGAGFGAHLTDNVAVAQRLFEAALDAPVRRVVVASSSSVYGSIDGRMAAETDPVRPSSPYGVSKATLELLASAYAARGVPIVALRYFTVYGPGQRPDMAISRMIESARSGVPFPLRGDGTQVRDFTHVDDVARATIAALTARLAPGTVVNVGSGRPVPLTEVLELVGDAVGADVPVERGPDAAGDPARTAADQRLATTLLGWEPSVPLSVGITDQVVAQVAGTPATAFPAAVTSA